MVEQFVKIIKSKLLTLKGYFQKAWSTSEQIERTWRNQSEVKNNRGKVPTMNKDLYWSENDDRKLN